MTIEAREYASSGEMNPAGNAVAVVPSDVTDLDQFTRALYIGAAGNLTVIMAGETLTSTTVVTFNNVISGTILPIRVRRIKATLTTASNIVALF